LLASRWCAFQGFTRDGRVTSGGPFAAVGWPDGWVGLAAHHVERAAAGTKGAGWRALWLVWPSDRCVGRWPVGWWECKGRCSAGAVVKGDKQSVVLEGWAVATARLPMAGIIPRSAGGWWCGW
jgi:hypothetical protein